MDKKGELTIQYLIGMIIAVIVLIVIIIIFREQISFFLEQTNGLIKKIFTPLADVEISK